MKFTTAIQARQNLRSRISDIQGNTDLRKLYNNIDSMVHTMSRLEVSARRTQRFDRVEECGDKIASALEYLDHLILIAKFMESD